MDLIVTTTTTTVLALICAVAAYLYISHRNRFRRLPPGPLANIIPFFGYLPLMGDSPHLKLCELAEQYGDAFTLKFGAYPIVVLNSSSLIRDSFKEPSFSGRPNFLLAMDLSKHGLTFATGPGAYEQRRFVLKTLRDFGFGKRSMESLILDEVAELVAYFRKSPGKTHSLEYLFGLSVINALWSILASRKFSIEDEYATKVYQVCIQGFIDPPVAGTLWFLPRVAKAFPNFSGYNCVVRAVDELRALVSEVVQAHRVEFDKTGNVRDFVDAYLAKIKKVTEAGETNSSFFGELGYTNLIHVLIDLFTAGSDTLNSSLNFAIKYLCENPEILGRLQTEIDDVVDSRSEYSEQRHVGTRLVTLDDRKSLPLLDAVITETLRISSIVTSGILHSTTEDSTPLVVDGKKFLLPKNTIIMPNLYWVHHNPQNWPDPNTFNPDRFVGRGNADVMAFSVGKRVCIAEQIAQAEFFMFLGGLLANFHFQGERGVTRLGTVKPGLVLNVSGLRVVVTPRGN